MHYYEVAPIKIVRAKVSFFTYESPEDLPVGAVVKVPIGNNQRIGVVFKKVEKPDFSTKTISGVIETDQLPLRLLKIATWMSEYYSVELPLVLQAIMPTGVDKKRRQKETTTTADMSGAVSQSLPLNKDQIRAVDYIKSSKQNTVLLHGITGSGKTNVYIDLVATALKNNKSAIVLVPEIALTPQLLVNFEKFFPGSVVLIHSKQTESERHMTWQKILRSKLPMVVIGPRSALFSPVRDLGIIIVDEAHEPSYKQEQSPRYNALRVASTIAKSEGIKAVLGTATPLTTDYYLARKAGAVVEMNSLAVNQESRTDIDIIDLKDRTKFKKHRFLSDKLLESIRNTLSDGRQCLIFHNRRGSSNITVCSGCGWQALCDGCRLPLTLHDDLYKFICHSCGSEYKIVTKCPVCDNTDILHKGVGTKLIYNELSNLFPNTKIKRFDGDSSSDSVLSDKDVYNDVVSGNTQIIIGTQMIAKGLDLPKLGMIGIVQADLGMALPDYTSEERTFQLLYQVIGRAKRGHNNSSIIIQTYRPDDDIIKFGAEQDYNGFYNHNLSSRKYGFFPPYCFMLKLTCIYKTEDACVRNARKLANELRRSFASLQTLGPMPDFHEHKSSGYRWQLVLKSKKRTDLLAVLGEDLGPHWQADIDPHSLL
jgi:primosomal protein N''